MGSVSVNENRCRQVAEVMQRTGYTPDKRSVTPFEDDPVRERSFLFFMVAIDHKTHGEKLSDTELYKLRDVTRKAVKEVAVRAQMDIGDVDDLFWGMGRETTALSLPIGRGDILKIRTVMDNRCKNAQAREEFLQTICAQEEVARQFPVPVYAETDFF